jgi:hypothetical protein
VLQCIYLHFVFPLTYLLQPIKDALYCSCPYGQSCHTGPCPTPR